jgi:hypothetical protein
MAATVDGDNRLPDNFFANQPDLRFAEIPVSEGDPPAVTARATDAISAAAGGAATDDGTWSSGSWSGRPTYVI